MSDQHRSLPSPTTSPDSGPIADRLIKATPLEQSLAPAVDPVWIGDFIMTLRLRDVPGTAIAAGLVEVNDHVASSGQSALEAFGSAEEYAATHADSLRPSGQTQGTPPLWHLIAPAIVGTLGLMLTGSSVRPLRDNTLVGLPLGMLLTTGLGLVAIVLVAVFAQPILRAVRRHPLLSLIAFGLFWIAAIVPPAFLRQEVAAIPAWPVGLAGLLLLACDSVLYWRLRTVLTDDPLVPPLDAEAAQPSRRTKSWLHPWIFGIIFWVAALVVGLVVWFVP